MCGVIFWFTFVNQKMLFSEGWNGSAESPSPQSFYEAQNLCSHEGHLYYKNSDIGVSRSLLICIN